MKFIAVFVYGVVDANWSRRSIVKGIKVSDGHLSVAYFIISDNGNHCAI